MYNNIPSWKVIPGDYKNFIVGKFFPFIQSDHWKSILIRQIRKLKRNKIEEKGEKRAPGTNIPKKEIPLKNIKARVAEQHRIHENAQSRNRSRVKQHSLNLLNEITNFLKGKGIEVIFFTPPYYYKYTELYKNEYIDEMKRAMNQLVESDGVEYLDYSTDRDIAYNADLFQDPDHINLEATRILAKKILKDLQR
ncbi:MAG: DUF1574 family protein [Thermodesulfobacteriota bacterium]|nr:DUF1574 family protein [Thermodesulfobacteriota bacterium]